MATTPSSPEDADMLTVGEEAVVRDFASSTSIAMTSGILRCSYFTAKKDQPAVSVLMASGAVAAGATPTLIRLGLWTATLAGALVSLVAATPNDLTLLTGLNTEYTKAFSVAGATVRGTRYAVGLLVVTAATAPQMLGATVGGQNPIMGRSPMKGGSLAGQTDLPASGSPSASISRPYFIIRPS